MAKGKERTEEEALAFIKPILPLLQRGMSMEQACDYAKIARPSVSRYKDKYEAVDTEIKTAKMQLIANANNTLYEASKTKPMYALEILKRRDRKRWGDEVKIEADVKVIPQILGGESVKLEEDNSSRKDITTTE